MWTTMSMRKFRGAKKGDPSSTESPMVRRSNTRDSVDPRLVLCHLSPSMVANTRETGRGVLRSAEWTCLSGEVLHDEQPPTHLPELLLGDGPRVVTGLHPQARHCRSLEKQQALTTARTTDNKTRGYSNLLQGHAQTKSFVSRFRPFFPHDGLFRVFFLSEIRKRTKGLSKCTSVDPMSPPVDKK